MNLNLFYHGALGKATLSCFVIARDLERGSARGKSRGGARDRTKVDKARGGARY